MEWVQRFLKSGLGGDPRDNIRALDSIRGYRMEGARGRLVDVRPIRGELGGWCPLLKEIKTFAEQVPQQPGSGGKQKEVAGQSMSRFGRANVEALVNIQEELAAKRMEALAARLGLAPEEAHIEVRRTAGGRCFGLLKFIVDIGFGIREVTATDIPKVGSSQPGQLEGRGRPRILREQRQHSRRHPRQHRRLQAIRGGCLEQRQARLS